MRQIVGFILFILAASPIISAQNNFTKRAVVSNLNTPWEILWGPDNFIWFTERYGKISRANPVSGEVTEIVLISEAKEVGEGGLLGMVHDPDFQNNNFFYVAYNYYNSTGQYRERIVRFTYNPSTGKASNPFILLDNIFAASTHNGCRLIISPDKKLLLTTGDARNTSFSQDVKSASGKILRLNLDGSIPSDNPFPNNPVWSWGHRNAQGLVFSPDGKILYSSEHGASSNDEINIIVKGRNYGWPSVEGFCDNQIESAFCRDSNVVEPIFAWTPTLAVAGMEFYNSDRIPEWKNSLLVTSLKASRVTQLLLDENKTKVVKTTDFFTNEFGRLRDICISPDGKVYLAVSNKDGRGSPNAGDDKIIEIMPVSTSSPDTNQSRHFSVYPNPGNEFIVVSFSDHSETQSNYILFNTLGQILKSGIIDQFSTKIYLPKDYFGMAFLQIKTGNQLFTEKVIIKR